jgi:hypothetical protein
MRLRRLEVAGDGGGRPSPAVELATRGPGLRPFRGTEAYRGWWAPLTLTVPPPRN